MVEVDVVIPPSSRQGTPCTSQASRRLLIVSLLRDTSLPLFSDPRFFAVALGIDLCQRRAGDGATTADLLCYEWHDDERERGLRMHRELAVALLRRAHMLYVDADVRALADEIALPVEERWRSAAHLIELQRHLPEHTIRALGGIETT